MIWFCFCFFDAKHIYKKKHCKSFRTRTGWKQENYSAPGQKTKVILPHHIEQYFIQECSLVKLRSWNGHYGVQPPPLSTARTLVYMDWREREPASLLVLMFQMGCKFETPSYRYIRLIISIHISIAMMRSLSLHAHQPKWQRKCLGMKDYQVPGSASFSGVCRLKRLHWKELTSRPIGQSFHGLNALSQSYLKTARTSGDKNWKERKL